MSLPQVTATGNLVKDAEVRFTGSGKAVASFTIACNASKKDENGNWVDGDTTYLDCSLWNAAERFVELVAKGQKIIVTGQLKQRKYETKDGSKRTAYEVNVQQVGLTPSKPQSESAPF